MKNKFVCIKLKTGENIFAELAAIDNELLRIYNPLNVRTYKSDDDSDGISLSKWIPFTDDNEFDIPTEVVMYVGKLSDDYTKFYGMSNLRYLVEDIQRTHAIKVRNGGDVEEAFHSMREDIESVIALASKKYGLDDEILRKTFISSDEDKADDIKIKNNVTLH